MTDFHNVYKQGYVRVTLNTKNYNDLDTEAIFFKVVDADGDYGFTALGVDQAIQVRDELTKLIEEFEALKPKEPTRREFIRALPQGTTFNNGTSEFIRLDGDNVYLPLYREVRTINDYFMDRENRGYLALSIGPVIT